ncbi:unnamed protein product, partial [Leptidea sinapis]
YIDEAKDFFPSVAEAIKIGLNLPVTTCTVERSFSTLRRVKTWNRSTSGDERLSGLCLFSVHHGKITKDNKDNFIENTAFYFNNSSRFPSGASAPPGTQLPAPMFYNKKQWFIHINWSVTPCEQEINIEMLLRLLIICIAILYVPNTNGRRLPHSYRKRSLNMLSRALQLHNHYYHVDSYENHQVRRKYEHENEDLINNIFDNDGAAYITKPKLDAERFINNLLNDIIELKKTKNNRGRPLN